MRDDADGRQARIANANFEGARFLGRAPFGGVFFAGSTHFGNAIFENDASFYGAEFEHYVSFHEATFNGLADFESASFGQAAFKRIEFGSVIFNRATFNDKVEFVSVHFNHTAEFNSIVARDRAIFLGCRFDGICVFHSTFALSGAAVSAVSSRLQGLRRG